MKVGFRQQSKLTVYVGKQLSLFSLGGLDSSYINKQLKSNPTEILSV